MNEINYEHKRFMKIYWFCVVSAMCSFAYIGAITFVPIPESGQRYADIALGYATATMLTGVYAYLLGGSPAHVLKKTNQAKPGTTEVTAEITATTTPGPEENKNE